MPFQSKKTNKPNNLQAVGDVQDPYYWWVAGGLWGLMLDYYHYTKDPSYNEVILQALLDKVNLGPENNYEPPEHKLEEGNDDLFFWGSAVLSAAERNFPQPKSDLPSWLEISENVFSQLESRWDTKDCGGGIFWQIRADNPNGLKYKNTISNGGAMNLAARLARATGKSSYLDWAEKIWDWSWNLKMIDNNNYHVYDGAGIESGCKKTNVEAYTYTTGIYLEAAAVMYNVTGKQEWADRAEKLLDGASWFFFNNGKVKNVMYEGACEPTSNCWLGNADMTTFKGFFSQLLWKTAIMMPSLQHKVDSYMMPTVEAAAKSCSGGQSGTACGDRWYNYKYEGRGGLGPQMCALGAIQGIFARDAGAPLPAKSIQRNANAAFQPIDPYKADPTTAQPAPPPPKATTDEAPKTTEPAKTTEKPSTKPHTATSEADPTTTEEPSTSVEPTTETTSESIPETTREPTTSEEPSSTSSIRSIITTTRDTETTTASTLTRPNPDTTSTVPITTQDTTTALSSEPSSTTLITVPANTTSFHHHCTHSAHHNQTSTSSLSLTTFVVPPPPPPPASTQSSATGNPPGSSDASFLTNDALTLLLVALGTTLATWGLA